MNHMRAIVGAIGLLVFLSSAVQAGGPEPGQPNAVDLGGGKKIDMAWIPAGEFMMGSTAEEREWAAGPDGKGEAKSFQDEGSEPQPMAVKQGFWLGRTEVTVAQWRMFNRAGYITEAEKKGSANCFDWENTDWLAVKGKRWKDPNFMIAQKPNHPVTCVSWNDANAFCAWLTKRAGANLPAGYVYRLPTEVEWEYACRGSKKGTKFWWGDAPEDGEGRANLSCDDPLGHKFPDDAWPDRFSWKDGYAWVSPVGCYGGRGRNAFGLSDMLGNVSEWCLDSYDRVTAHDPVYKGKSDFKVLRGGNFSSVPGRVRCAERNRDYPTAAASRFGFRVCLGVKR